MPSLTRLSLIALVAFFGLLSLSLNVHAAPIPALATDLSGRSSIVHAYARNTLKKRQNLPAPDEVITEADVPVEDAASSDGGGVVVAFEGTASKRAKKRTSADIHRLEAKSARTRGGLAAGKSSHKDRSVKRQTNEVPAQLPTKGTVSGDIIPFGQRKRSRTSRSEKRQTNELPAQLPSKGTVDGAITPFRRGVTF